MTIKTPLKITNTEHGFIADASARTQGCLGRAAASTAATKPAPVRAGGTVGFTLIETLVAVTILVSAIAGPLTIASRGLASASIARDQLVANFLAQEAIEFVRNTRDENVLRGSDWLAGLGSCAAQGCEIDVPNATVNGCGKECEVLEYHTTQSLYGFGSGDDWVPTRFRRMTIVTEIIQDIETEVTVTVSWQTGSVTREFTVTDYLLNWQEE